MAAIPRLVVVVFVLALGACSASQSDPGGPGEPGQSLDLTGRTFLSTRATQGGSDDPPLQPGTEIRLSFMDDGRIVASAGCNTMSGTYRLDGATLRVGNVGVTEMGCDPARHAQDEWLFGPLGSGPAVALAGDDLTLTAGDVVVTLTDREVAEPDLPLVGTTWTVASLIPSIADLLDL